MSRWNKKAVEEKIKKLEQDNKKLKRVNLKLTEELARQRKHLVDGKEVEVRTTMPDGEGNVETSEEKLVETQEVPIKANEIVRDDNGRCLDFSTFNSDVWILIAKAEAHDKSWYKSTKVMEFKGLGILVQVTTRENLQAAEALEFIPGAKLIKDKNGIRIGKA